MGTFGFLKTHFEMFGKFPHDQFEKLLFEKIPTQSFLKCVVLENFKQSFKYLLF